MREIIRRVESITQEIRKKKREIEELEELIREREEEKREKWEKLDELRGKIDAIIEEIKNTDAYKRLINSFNKVEDLYRQLIDSEYNAGKIFNYLSPFAYTRKLIPLYRVGYLVISRKVYLAPEYHGVVQKRRPSPRELFRTIVEHGDVVIPNVRRSIREDLAELCELGKKLTAEISEEIKIIRFGYGFELGERLAARIPEAKISHVREFRIWELDEFQGILSLSRMAGKQLQELKGIDHTASEVAEHMATIEASASEASIQLADYLSELTFNPERLEEVEGRLAELEKIIRRHGNSLRDVLSGVENYQKEIEELNNSEERLGELDSKIIKLREEIGSLGLKIRLTRRETGTELSKLIESQLSDLALSESTFKIVQNEIQPTENHFCTINGERVGITRNGLDHVEFHISTNAGMPPEPISKVASGGELSRIMLAMKVILAEVDSIPTLVFDEVDSGVGGRTGEMIGRKLARLAKNRQVICITHLPQIAVFADTHLRIIKSVEDGETSIECMELEKRGCIDEIARMGSGDKITQVSLKHAQEMLVSAEKFKKSLSL